MSDYSRIKVGGVWVYEHRHLAAKALGRKLPAGAEIHHVNEDKKDNSPGNLVLCENHEYHEMLHMRAKAVAAGFPATHRKCQICGEYDDVVNMSAHQTGYRHKSCNAAYQRDRSQRRSRNESKTTVQRTIVAETGQGAGGCGQAG